MSDYELGLFIKKCLNHVKLELMKQKDLKH